MPSGMPVKRVRDHVAFLEKLQDLRQRGNGVDGMNHERQLDGIGRLAGNAQGRHIVFAGHAAREADFQAQNHVPILLDGANGQLRVGEAQVDQLAPGTVVRHGCLADHGNVQQRIDARIDGVDHHAPEAGKGVRARRTGIQCGGDAFGDAVRIGGDGKRRDTIVDMNVNVDQARGHDIPARVDDDSRLALRNAGGDRRHFVPGDRDVTNGGERLRRIDHVSALDEQIVLRRGSRGLGFGGRQ